MNQLVPFGIGAAAATDKVLNAVSAISNNYFRYKLIQGESINNVPYLIGNTTQTLIMTNSLLEMSKHFTGNVSESLVPSFHHLITNQTAFIQAQTKAIATQNHNQLMVTHAAVATWGSAMTIVNLGEAVCATNPFSRLCFAGGAILNGIGTACSAASMMINPSRGLSPFGVLINGLGTGCFMGAKYCRELGNRTRF